MTTIDFPLAPVVGMEFEAAGTTYVWNGTGWVIKPVDPSGQFYTKPESDVRYVNAAGDTMTGLLTMPYIATVPEHVANKAYVDSRGGLTVDSADLRYLKLAGGVMAGPVSTLPPTDTAHATNKAYVDAADALKADKTYVDAQDAAISATVALKADKTYVDAQDAAINATVALKADKTYVDSQDAAVNANANNRVAKTGDTMTAQLNFSTPGAHLHFNGGVYGSYIYSDAGQIYFPLLTNVNDPNGAWNTLRPITVTLANGNVSLGHAVSVGGLLSVTGMINLGGRNALSGDTSYTILYDPAGRGSIYMGNADAQNYYRNSVHNFGSVNHAIQYATIGNGATNITGTLSASVNVTAASVVSAGAYVSSPTFYFSNSGNAYYMTWDGGNIAFNGNLYGHAAITINGGATLGSVVGGIGYRARQGSAGVYSGSSFNIEWTGSAHLWMDQSYLGGISLISDYRAKKDVADLPSTWDKVKALRPISYTHKEFTPQSQIEYIAGRLEKGETDGPSGPLIPADDIVRWGFMAHELQETLLHSAAYGEKDSTFAVQSPNLAPVVAALTKALQEAMARIEALEAA
jgi:hypothetical protein